MQPGMDSEVGLDVAGPLQEEPNRWLEGVVRLVPEVARLVPEAAGPAGSEQGCTLRMVVVLSWYLTTVGWLVGPGLVWFGL